METILANSELNWEFVEPLNEKALSGLEDQLKMGLSDAFKDFVKRSNYGFSQWRSFMVGNKSYTFKHVLNFNLEDMLRIAYDLENLEDDTQYQRRKINEQIEEAKSLMKQIDMNFYSSSEIDKLVREAKEHEREASKRYDEYLKSKDKND